MYSELQAQYEALTNELADLRSQYASLEEEKNNPRYDKLMNHYNKRRGDK